MFSLDSLLQDAFPHRNTPAWQRSLLRTLLFEKNSNSSPPTIPT